MTYVVAVLLGWKIFIWRKFLVYSFSGHQHWKMKTKFCKTTLMGKRSDCLISAPCETRHRGLMVTDRGCPCLNSGDQPTFNNILSCTCKLLTFQRILCVCTVWHVSHKHSTSNSQMTVMCWVYINTMIARKCIISDVHKQVSHPNHKTGEIDIFS